MKDNKNIIIVIILAILVYFAGIYAFKQYSDRNKVSVYFVKQESITKNQVIPVKRTIKKDKMTTAMTELLKGPSEKEKKEGFFTEIPPKTKLLGIKEKPEEFEVNLSSDLNSGGGSESMKLRLQQIFDTANDAADGKSVYLKVNSKKAEYIGGEGLEVPQPINKK